MKIKLVRESTLAFTIILGGAAAAYLVLLSSFPAGDFQTYYAAAENAVSGSQFIGADAPMPHGSYVYLPITLLFFIPFSLLPQWTVAYPLLIGLNVAGGIILGHLVILILKERGVTLSNLNIALVVGCFTVSSVGVLNLLQTQPNLWLAVFVVAGFRFVQQDRPLMAGILFAIPAIVKLWPALLGVWLLYRHEWRAIAVAVATGVSAIIASVLVFGVDVNVRFFNHILAERSWTDNFAGGVDPDMQIVTIRRPISMLLPSLDPAFMAIIGLLICGVLLVTFYWLGTVGDIDPFLPFSATLVLMTIAFPSITPYAVFFLVPGVIYLYQIDTPAYIYSLSISTIMIALTFTPKHINSIISLLPLPRIVSTGINQLIRTVLQYGSIPLWGALILLAMLGVISLRRTSTETEWRENSV